MISCVFYLIFGGASALNLCIFRFVQALQSISESCVLVPYLRHRGNWSIWGLLGCR